MLIDLTEQEIAYIESLIFYKRAHDYPAPLSAASESLLAKLRAPQEAKVWEPVEEGFVSKSTDDEGNEYEIQWDEINELLYVTEARPEDVADAVGNRGTTVFVDFSFDAGREHIRLCRLVTK